MVVVGVANFENYLNEGIKGFDVIFFEVVAGEKDQFINALVCIFGAQEVVDSSIFISSLFINKRPDVGLLI